MVFEQYHRALERLIILMCMQDYLWSFSDLEQHCYDSRDHIMMVVEADWYRTVIWVYCHVLLLAERKLSCSVSEISCSSKLTPVLLDLSVILCYLTLLLALISLSERLVMLMIWSLEGKPFWWNPNMWHCLNTCINKHTVTCTINLKAVV